MTPDTSPSASVEQRYEDALEAFVVAHRRELGAAMLSPWAIARTGAEAFGLRDLLAENQRLKQIEKAARRLLRNMPAYGLGPPEPDGRGYLPKHARSVADLRAALARKEQHA
jgi:hypothetical protein